MAGKLGKQPWFAQPQPHSSVEYTVATDQRIVIVNKGLCKIWSVLSFLNNLLLVSVLRYYLGWDSLKFCAISDTGPQWPQFAGLNNHSFSWT